MRPIINPLPLGRASFLNAPRCTSLDLLNADVAVLGCPWTTPDSIWAARAPSSEAPDAVRSQSLRLADTLDHYDFDSGGVLLPGERVSIVDCGDVWAIPGRYSENDLTASQSVEALLDSGALPLILGGDHAATTPAVRACHRDEQLCVVHFGADLDFCDDVDGVRDGPRSAMRRVSELPWVASMMHIGLRGSGASLRCDVDAAAALGHVLVRAEEVHQVGAAEVTARIPDAASYFISLDITCLDPAIAPGVAVPSFGGLTYFEATNLLKGIVTRGPVIGMSLVGIVPAHDVHGLTSLLGTRLILNLLGAMVRADTLPVRVPVREWVPAGG
jgi:agmatinase